MTTDEFIQKHLRKHCLVLSCTQTRVTRWCQKQLTRTIRIDNGHDVDLVVVQQIHHKSIFGCQNVLVYFLYHSREERDGLFMYQTRKNRFLNVIEPNKKKEMVCVSANQGLGFGPSMKSRRITGVMISRAWCIATKITLGSSSFSLTLSEIFINGSFRPSTVRGPYSLESTATTHIHNKQPTRNKKETTHVRGEGKISLRNDKEMTNKSNAY